MDLFRAAASRAPTRTAPSAGNLVGFLGTDRALAGTELEENACLAGHNGTATFERSADGVRLPGSLEVTDQPTDGSTVHLTIDADLQWFAQQKLAEQAQAIGADWGTVMIVRVTTGEIVVAADWPAIDPNDLDSVSAENSGARSFTEPFEPGSIMKPVAFAALLDRGLITPGTPLTIPNNYKAPGSFENITDSFNAGNARWTATGVLMNSSNIGTVMLSESLTAQQKYDYFTAFGFGERTGAGFLGEDGGTVRTPAETTADPSTLAAQMFGQGITATSAQMASLYQTLGNGGVRIPLTLVSGCEAPDGTWTDVPVPTGERVVSEYAAETTLQMMETVASQGFLAQRAQHPGVPDRGQDRHRRGRRGRALRHAAHRVRRRRVPRRQSRVRHCRDAREARYDEDVGGRGPRRQRDHGAGHQGLPDHPVDGTGPESPAHLVAGPPQERSRV